MLNRMFFLNIVMAGSLAVMSCSKTEGMPSAEDQKHPRPVKIAAVEQSTAPIPVESSGRLASSAEMMLSFKIGGVVEKILVEEGQSVRKGQLLAHLNLTEIDARVRQAKNAYDKAGRDFARVKALFEDTVATMEQYQDARTGLEVAEAEYEIATFNQRYAKIIAPADGKVLRRFAERGELVNPGMPVLQIGASSGAAQLIRIGVSDRDVVRLVPGDSAQVRFDAYPGVLFSAHVSEIAAAADPRSGAFEVELTVESGDFVLKNGFVGKVTLYPGNQPAYFRIPMRALVEGAQDRVTVLIPENNYTTTRRLSLRPDYVGSDFFTVLARESGDIREVVTDGAAYVRDGETITVVGRSGDGSLAEAGDDE